LLNLRGFGGKSTGWLKNLAEDIKAEIIPLRRKIQITPRLLPPDHKVRIKLDSLQRCLAC